MSGNNFWVFYDTFAKIQSNFMSSEDAQASILKMRPQDVERFLIWTAGWQNWQTLKAYLVSDQKNFVSTFTVPGTVPKLNEDTLTAAKKEFLEQSQISYSLHRSKKEDTITKSYSSIRLEEETISRIVRQDEELLGISMQKTTNFSAEEITWSKSEKPAVDFSKLATKTMSQRDQRHALKIEVLLISARGKTFRSRSKNISLSGTLLEDTIPFDYYDTSFDVVIINTQTRESQKSRVKLTGSVINNSGGLSSRIQFTSVNEMQKINLQNLLETYSEGKKQKNVS